ncbi:MAG: TFIIB-type zinc ribbon-containing protein [Candidatus Nomurabacteria bacterium]|jgi:ribosomal protein S27E|nr:TFIIB-type zinc ribbon-containing protein [Candidatus Nomurabacteria bacterium]
MGNDSVNPSNAQVVNTSSGKKTGLDRCPFCGSTDIIFDQKLGKLKCLNCRSVFEPEHSDALISDIHNLVGEVIGSGSSNIVPDTATVLTFKCSSCGAEIVIDTAESATARCHWCRHTLGINDQIPNGAVPDMVLPFAIAKQDAQARIAAFMEKRKFFANTAFRNEFTVENITGVFLPYMVVDINARAQLSGQGEHLVRRYSVGSGKNRQTRYDADLYNVERNFDLLIDDLIIESSADKLDQNTTNNTNNVINSILPFDTENCIKWDANYLKGFASEKRDTNIDNLRDKVGLQAKDVARNMANQTLTFYDRGVQWTQDGTNIKGTAWKSAYLPVWLYSYQQISGDKKLLHYCAVNARTGETMGSVPLNMAKVIGITVLLEILFGGAGLSILMGVDGKGGNMGLFGFLPGIIFFFYIRFKYRNTNKRHHHESETKATAENLTTRDEFVEHRKRLSNSRMNGANNKKILGSSAKMGAMDSFFSQFTKG